MSDTFIPPEDLEQLKAFINDSDYDVNQRDEENQTPIMLSAARGHTPVVKMLLDKG